MTTYTPDTTKPRPWWKWTVLYMEGARKTCYVIFDKNITDECPYRNTYPVLVGGQYYKSNGREYALRNLNNQRAITDTIAELRALDDAAYGRDCKPGRLPTMESTSCA